MSREAFNQWWDTKPICAETLSANPKDWFSVCWQACAARKDARIAELEADNARLREALEFYANPDTYFAVSVFSDPPCGAFMDDFSTHGHPDYHPNDERPGKRARHALGG